MTARAIVSVCYGGFPGSNRHLREIGRATDLTRHLVISTRDPASVEVAFLREHLATLAPRLVIFGSWHATYEPLADAARAAGAEVAVLWTSSAGQTEIGGESALLAGLVRDPRIGRFFVASADMIAVLAASGRTSEILPHALVVAVPPDAGARAAPSPPALSLFCAPSEYRRKNVGACLDALAHVGAPYELQVNGLGADAGYGARLAELKIPYRDLGWMDDAAYARALGGIDLGLQPSLADSFNYVVADHFARGIPVVVSRFVPCADGLPEGVARLLVVDDPADGVAIAAAIRRLLAAPDERHAAGRAVRAHIENVATRNGEVARRILLAACREP